MFGYGRFKHFDLGTTSANTYFYPRTAVEAIASQKLLYFYDEYKKPNKNCLLQILYVNFIESTLAYNNDRVLLIIEEFFLWKGYMVVSVVFGNCGQVLQVTCER